MQRLTDPVTRIATVATAGLALMAGPSLADHHNQNKTDDSAGGQNEKQAEQAQGKQTQGEQSQSKEGTQELEIELPEPMFTGTPGDLPTDQLNLDPKRTTRLDKDEARESLMVPEGVKLISKGKPVKASEDFLIIGSTDLVTDGDANHSVGTYMELGPGKQWVQIDLQDQYEIYAVALWHYHNQGRVYKDVVVQISSDDNFKKGAKTVFNNDNDNSLGLGAGDDREYIENHEGRRIKVDGVEGR